MLLRDEHEARVRVSVGIALCPDAALSSDALLRAADAAMYTAKSSGSGYHIHNAQDPSPTETQTGDTEAPARRAG